MNGIPLMRGQGDRDQTTAQEMLTAVVLCGILIAVAAPAVKWITGYDTVTLHVTDKDGNAKDMGYWTDDAGALNSAYKKLGGESAAPDYDAQKLLDHALPPSVTTIFDKLIMGIRAIAAFVMIIALVWGGIKLEARDPLKVDAPAERQTRKSIPQSGE